MSFPEGTTIQQLQSIADITQEHPFIDDLYDCDDFATAFEAQSKAVGINCVGLVWGYWLPLQWQFWERLHFWNIALADSKAYQIEPQTGEIGRTLKDHWAFLGIIRA